MKNTQQTDRELCPRCGDWKVAGYPSGKRQCLACNHWWDPQTMQPHQMKNYGEELFPPYLKIRSRSHD